MSFDLMLHKGSVVRERHEIKALPTPLPTTTHHPVPHSEFIDLVEIGLDREGFEIAETSFGISQDNQRLFGLIRLAGENEEFGNVVGLRNSHDKKFPAGLCIGSNVFVCDNLCFSGEIKVTRKHTAKIRYALPGMVFEATASMEYKFGEQAKRINAYKEIELSPIETNDLLVNMAENDSVTWRDIPKILAEFREPRHECFEGNSLYSFWNATTEISKKQPLETLCRRTQSLHKVLDQRAGIHTGSTLPERGEGLTTTPDAPSILVNTLESTD